MGNTNVSQDAVSQQNAERVLLSNEELIHRFRSLCIRFGEAQYAANYEAGKELGKRANEYEDEIRRRLYRNSWAAHAT
jgi:predicted hydrocarbon binding protein